MPEKPESAPIDKLSPVPVTEPALAEFEKFDFGEEDFQSELLHWIRHEAKEAIESGMQVWMYFNRAHQIVGYGSLGLDAWETPAGEKDLFIIPAMALRKEFWGQPSGSPREWRYSSQILEDLIRKATEWNEQPTDARLLGLIVQPGNAKAVKLYKRHGFEKFSYTYTVPGTRKRYESYVLPLKRVAGS